MERNSEKLLRGRKKRVLVCYSGLGGAAGTSHEPMFQHDVVASFSL